MNSTFYILYKTTNLINGNIYIGIHQTNNLNDGYLGSGKNLLNAIKKYGKPNFYREILEFFIDEKSMVDREIEIVTEDFCKRKDTYNIMPGGKWGSYQRNGLSFKGRHHTKESKIKRIGLVVCDNISSIVVNTNSILVAFTYKISSAENPFWDKTFSKNSGSIAFSESK